MVYGSPSDEVDMNSRISSLRVTYPFVIASTLLAVSIVGCGSDGTAAPTVPTTVSTAPSTSAAAVVTTASPVTTIDPLVEGVPGDLPDGVYRTVITDADLDAVNVPEDAWSENHGTFTWTLKQGKWSVLQEADNPIKLPTANGVYIVDGDHVTFEAVDISPEELTWTAAPDGSLVFTSLPSTGVFMAAYLASHPLVPVTS